MSNFDQIVTGDVGRLQLGSFGHAEQHGSRCVRSHHLAARFQRIWPQTILILLVIVTAAWIVLLGYGLVGLVEMVP